MKVAVSLIVFGSLLTHVSDSQPVIYRCDGEDGLMFSDRACGVDSDPHEIDDSRVTVYSPAPAVQPASPPTAAKRAKASRAKSGKATNPAEQRTNCARLEQGLRDIRAKMRGGYGAKEGERLKARQRQLNQQRRQQKCG